MLQCWLWKWKLRPPVKECKQPLQVGKGKKMDSPLWASRRNAAPKTNFRDFWPPELKRINWHFCYSITCYSSSKKQIYHLFHKTILRTRILLSCLHILDKYFFNILCRRSFKNTSSKDNLPLELGIFLSILQLE